MTPVLVWLLVASFAGEVPRLDSNRVTPLCIGKDQMLPGRFSHFGSHVRTDSSGRYALVWNTEHALVFDVASDSESWKMWVNPPAGSERIMDVRSARDGTFLILWDGNRAQRVTPHSGLVADVWYRPQDSPSAATFLDDSGLVLWRHAAPLLGQDGATGTFTVAVPSVPARRIPVTGPFLRAWESGWVSTDGGGAGHVRYWVDLGERRIQWQDDRAGPRAGMRNMPSPPLSGMDPFRVVASSRDGRWVALGRLQPPEDPDVRAYVLQLWSALPWVYHGSVRGLGAMAQAVAFSEDGRHLAATDAAHLRVWSIEGDTPTLRYSTACVIGCSGVAFAPGPDVEILSVSAPESTSLVRWRACR